MTKKGKVQKEKPLEKMTAKELREAARSIEDIEGAHGMNKEELLAAIRKARGIAEPQSAKKVSMREVKAKIRDLAAKAAQAKVADDQRLFSIYRKRAAKLKKKTRRAASM